MSKSTKSAAKRKSAAPRPAASGRSKAKPSATPGASARDWMSAARVRTLPLAIAPVALGTGIGILEGGTLPWQPVNALLCLVIALTLQIGVNFANDYSDGVRGTDRYRVGPARLVGSGAAKPTRVLSVAIAFFAIAALAGLALTVLTAAWWLLAVGAAALLAAWFYTGGRRPYGYYGLGEVVVFIFFGLVATMGSAWAQSQVLFSQIALLGGAAMGSFACAVLVANNLRDREQDKLAGKKTLAVLIGPVASRVLFGVLMLVPFVLLVPLTLIFPEAGFVYFALLLALPTVAIVGWGRTAQELILSLQLASLTSLCFGLGLGVLLAL